MPNTNSGRIIQISKQRERAKEDVEKLKQKLEKEKMQADIKDKFTTNVETMEDQLKAETVGLVSLDRLKEKQLEFLKKADDLAIGKESSPVQDKPATASKSTVNRAAEKRVLSFGGFEDDEEDEDLAPPVEKRLGMNPDVDTSFLPDRDREQLLMKRKEELAQEWRQQQEKEKNEEITVAFAYFDGSAHRKDTRIKKGATIGQFLQKAIDLMKKEFAELRTVTPESLMFVKEDLILPHFYSFQDFIATRNMGKTGPLWQFDAAGEVRLRQDAALDCGESHPAKVVMRSWFEKNKHVYPCSRWEPFVAGKEYSRTMDDLSKI